MMISFFTLATHLFVPIGHSNAVTSQEEVLPKPSQEHALALKNAFLDTVELEDRSTWEIAPPDVYKIVSWEIGDTVVLTPHSSYFSIYKFQFSLSNLKRNSYVRVNFKSHPCDYQKASRWIISLDTFSNRVFLNDGSCWKIHPDDAYLAKNWSINDFLIYGKNDQLLGTHPYLLINTRLNHYVRAIDF